MKIFILEDNPNRIEFFEKCLRKEEEALGKRFQIHIVNNYGSAAHQLTTERYDIVYLDHDLGEEKTGYDVVREMVKKDATKRHKVFRIHSANPIGANRMRNLIRDYTKYVENNFQVLMGQSNFREDFREIVSQIRAISKMTQS